MENNFEHKVTEHMARTNGDIKTLFRDGENRDKQIEKLITLMMNRQNAVIALMVTIILSLIAIIYKG